METIIMEEREMNKRERRLRKSMKRNAKEIAKKYPSTNRSRMRLLVPICPGSVMKYAMDNDLVGEPTLTIMERMLADKMVKPQNTQLHLRDDNDEYLTLFSEAPPTTIEDTVLCKYLYCVSVILRNMHEWVITLGFDHGDRHKGEAIGFLIETSLILCSEDSTKIANVEIKLNHQISDDELSTMRLVVSTEHDIVLERNDGVCVE